MVSSESLFPLWFSFSLLALTRLSLLFFQDRKGQKNLTDRCLMKVPSGAGRPPRLDLPLMGPSLSPSEIPTLGSLMTVLLTLAMSLL